MKIEIEKPVIPQFVADWIEEARKERYISTLFGKSLSHEMYVWYAEDKVYKEEMVAIAFLYGYEVEQEPLHYAKIKGWEFATNKNTFWNYRHIVGRPMLSRLYTGSKEEDSFVRTTMTIEEWNKLGINDTNADFEEVEQ